MKSNRPTLCDKFAQAQAKLEDITKRKKGEGERRKGGGGKRKCLVGVHVSFFKCPSQDKKATKFK